MALLLGALWWWRSEAVPSTRLGSWASRGFAVDIVVGLIAFASLTPIIFVMAYGMLY